MEQKDHQIKISGRSNPIFLQIRPQGLLLCWFGLCFHLNRVILEFWSIRSKISLWWTYSKFCYILRLDKCNFKFVQHYSEILSSQIVQHECIPILIQDISNFISHKMSSIRTQICFQNITSKTLMIVSYQSMWLLLLSIVALNTFWQQQELGVGLLQRIKWKSIDNQFLDQKIISIRWIHQWRVICCLQSSLLRLYQFWF